MMIIKCGSWTWNSDLVIFQVCKISMVRSPRQCFGTIVNLQCTSRLGLSSLALTNVITETFRFSRCDANEFFKSSRLESKSNHSCLSQLATLPRSFTYGWFMVVTTNMVQNLAVSVLLFCPFMTWSFKTWTHFFQDLASQVLKQKGKSSPLTCPNALHQALDLIGLGIPSLELNLTHLGNYLTFHFFKLKTWVFVARFSALAHQWS